MGDLGISELLLILIVIGIPVVVIVLIIRAVKAARKTKGYSADELEKLFQLKEKGIITPEEFENLKSKLI